MISLSECSDICTLFRLVALVNAVHIKYRSTYGVLQSKIVILSRMLKPWTLNRTCLHRVIWNASLIIHMIYGRLCCLLVH